MDRRRLLTLAAAAPLAAALPSIARAAATTGQRVRPGDPEWPDTAAWDKLRETVGGRLVKVETPLAACAGGPDSEACRNMLAALRNPYYIGDQPGATQSTGWVDAWQSAPSVYAVAAKTTADVVAAVNFAREHNLRLVVKGGGHSYQGTSNAPDSFLVWTRAMSDITPHDAFVPQGCAGTVSPQAAVSLGAGAIWMHVYDAVTTQGRRYVQGGGCATVGVAGLIQSGGFGSFSKHYGTAASWLLEAEIVTADGQLRVVNACSEPELFWGLKGGGGGCFGVVTRITLKTHDLADWAGGAFLTVKATSDQAFRDLIAGFIRFYAEHLFNPHWGESVAFRRDNSLSVSMVSRGLDKPQAAAVWQPFLDWIAASRKDFRLDDNPVIISMPARQWWNAVYRTEHTPKAVKHDDRPGAPESNVWWAGDSDQVGKFWYGYELAWLPAALLEKERQGQLVDALFAASQQWTTALHFNKGLAGAPEAAITAAKETATNPAVQSAFALAIIAGGGPPAYPGLSGHEPDLSVARPDARAIARAMQELRKAAPYPGSYYSESSYFEEEWQKAHWGANYPRLQAVKAKYDPDGLFFVHHGVGSEMWSEDGFTRLAAR